MLEGRQSFVAEFRVLILPSQLILLLRHTLGNVMCIVTPLDRGYQPQFTGYSRGQPFFVVELSRVSVAWLTHVITVAHSQEYNVYFRVVGQGLTALDPKGAQGQAIFCN